MLWMKHAMTILALTVIRWLSVIGLLGCVILAFLPLGCVNSIETAPLRYREQHQNDGHLLPDSTVERFQACVEKYGHELESQSYRVEAKVQVDQEGRIRDVLVGGIPDNAPDLAACTRITLREMAVPTSVLQLRPGQTVGMTNGQTMPMGNEVANPIVAWEIGAALAEFVAQHGGRIVLYTVTIEVLGTIAVAGTLEMLKRNRWRKNCTDGFVNCKASPTGWGRGNNWNITRCGSCLEVCGKTKSWPTSIEMFPEGTVSCN